MYGKMSKFTMVTVRIVEDGKTRRKAAFTTAGADSTQIRHAFGMKLLHDDAGGSKFMVVEAESNYHKLTVSEKRPFGDVIVITVEFESFDVL